MGSVPSTWPVVPEERPGLTPMSLLMPKPTKSDGGQELEYFVCEGCGKKCATRRARLAHRKFCDKYIIWKGKTVKWKIAVDATKKITSSGTPKAFVLTLLIESNYFNDDKVIQISKMRNHNVQMICSNWLLSYRGKRLFTKKTAKVFRLLINSGFFHGYKDKTSSSLLTTNTFWHNYVGPKLVNVCDMSLSAIRSASSKVAYKRFHWFHTIDFTKITDLRDADLMKIIVNAPNVKHVYIGWCTNISPMTFQRCMWHFEHLESIDVRGCKLNNDVCFAIGDCCPNLRSLNLSGAIYLKDFVVKNITEKCPHLIEVRLSGCELLTKLSMEYLTLKESLNLYELDLKLDKQCCRAPDMSSHR